MVPEGTECTRFIQPQTTIVWPWLIRAFALTCIASYYNVMTGLRTGKLSFHFCVREHLSCVLSFYWLYKAKSPGDFVSQLTSHFTLILHSSFPQLTLCHCYSFYRFHPKVSDDQVAFRLHVKHCNDRRNVIHIVVWLNKYPLDTNHLLLFSLQHWKGIRTLDTGSVSVGFECA